MYCYYSGIFLPVEGLNRVILIKKLKRVPIIQDIETESEVNILLKDYKPSEMLDLVHFKSVTGVQKDRHFQMQSPPICKSGGLKIECAE